MKRIARVLMVALVLCLATLIVAACGGDGNKSPRGGAAWRRGRHVRGGTLRNAAAGVKFQKIFLETGKATGFVRFYNGE